MNFANIWKKADLYSYEIIFILIIASHYGAILYTNSFLGGANINDFVDLSSNTIQTATLKSANLPVFNLFEFLYKTLHLSNEFIKACIALFCLVLISLSIYKMCIHAFGSKLSGLLAVILFLYSSLFYAVLFSNINFIDDSNPDSLSFTFIMLAILFWLKDRYALSSLFLGISFDCHPILPIGCIAAFFLYQLANFRSIKIKNILFSVIIFLIVTLPVTLSIIKSLLMLKMLTASGLDPELIWRYIKFAQPQSAFIDTIPGFHYGLSLYISSFLVLLLFLRYGGKHLQKQCAKIFFLIFVVFAFVIFELLNSHFLKVIPLYNLWFHRFLSYGSVMNYIALAGGVFFVLNGGFVNGFLRICLFLLLVYSVFSYEFNLDLYMTFWSNHFYILEIVIVYYAYNFFRLYKKSELKWPDMILNVIFFVGTLMYLFYISVYDRFNPPNGLFDLFQRSNVRPFYELIFQKQFQYPFQYEYYQGFYILLVCLMLFGMAALVDILRRKLQGHEDLRT